MKLVPGGVHLRGEIEPSVEFQGLLLAVGVIDHEHLAVVVPALGIQHGVDAVDRPVIAGNVGLVAVEPLVRVVLEHPFEVADGGVPLVVPLVDAEVRQQLRLDPTEVVRHVQDAVDGLGGESHEVDFAVLLVREDWQLVFVQAVVLAERLRVGERHAGIEAVEVQAV